MVYGSTELIFVSPDAVAIIHPSIEGTRWDELNGTRYDRLHPDEVLVGRLTLHVASGRANGVHDGTGVDQ